MSTVLMAVAGDLSELRSLSEHLMGRYGTDYELRLEDSLLSAERTLERLAKQGRSVAIVLVDWVTVGDGLEAFLGRAARLHPGVRRGAQIAVGDRGSSDDVLRAAVRGLVEFWAIRPWRVPDEVFHAQVTEALREWADANLPPRDLVRLVGERWDARAHELRDLFQRNRIPHASYDVASVEGRTTLEAAGVGTDRLPVLALFDGRVLIDPSNAELATALGVKTRPENVTFDVVVIGGGPAGLAASVYATSEGLRTALIEREAMGGQAGTTSLIRNYLGFPRGVSGSELMQRAYEQAWSFGTEFVYANEATALRSEGDHRVVTLADGTEVSTRAVILAMGVSYRRLGTASVDALIGAGVFYGAAVTEANAMTGELVYVLGGGNSAGQAAAHLARFAAHVTVLVRGPSLAESMSEYLIAELEALPNVDIRYRTEVIDAAGEARLESLVLRDLDTHETTSVPAAALFVLIGADPHTDWLPEEIVRDRWGYVLTGRDVADEERQHAGWAHERQALPLETSLPGVFAAGDVRHGSVKRIASSVGEGSIAVRLVHGFLSESGR
jgi:thioredoxin reductase (NADPH)